MAENTEVKQKAPRKSKVKEEIPENPTEQKKELVEKPIEKSEEISVETKELVEEISEKAENLPAESGNSPEEVENSPEKVGDLAEQPAAEPKEQEILSGPAELAKINSNLPDDRSKWVARLVAEKGYHILFKGSFPKAYRVADNYNVLHGFPAGKIRRIYN